MLEKEIEMVNLNELSRSVKASSITALALIPNNCNLFSFKATFMSSVEQT